MAYPTTPSHWVWAELGTRIVVFIVFVITEYLPTPFHRVIQPEEAWLYRFRDEASIVPSSHLWVILVISLVVVITLVYGYNKDLSVVFAAVAVISLALPFNGIITNIVKLAVGRPRPNYLHRCYGNAYLDIQDFSLPCTGNPGLVADGRKSFPSGHSSMSFCGFGFLSLFLAGQFKVFSILRGRSYGILLCCIPLLTATLVAVSRTCDYHHHWQDISVGSFLGLAIVFLVYRQYFPALGDIACDKPNIEDFEFLQDWKHNSYVRESHPRGQLLGSVKTV